MLARLNGTRMLRLSGLLAELSRSDVRVSSGPTCGDLLNAVAVPAVFGSSITRLPKVGGLIGHRSIAVIGDDCKPTKDVKDRAKDDHQYDESYGYHKEKPKYRSENLLPWSSIHRTGNCSANAHHEVADDERLDSSRGRSEPFLHRPLRWSCVCCVCHMEGARGSNPRNRSGLPGGYLLRWLLVLRSIPRTRFECKSTSRSQAHG